MRATATTTLYLLLVGTLGGCDSTPSPGTDGSDADTPPGDGGSGPDRSACAALGESCADAECCTGNCDPASSTCISDTIDAGHVWTLDDCMSGNLTVEHDGEPCEGEFFCEGYCPCGGVSIECVSGMVEAEGDCTDCSDGGTGCPSGDLLGHEGESCQTDGQLCYSDACEVDQCDGDCHGIVCTPGEGGGSTDLEWRSVEDPCRPIECGTDTCSGDQFCFVDCLCCSAPDAGPPESESACEPIPEGCTAEALCDCPELQGIGTCDGSSRTVHQPCA